MLLRYQSLTVAALLTFSIVTGCGGDDDNKSGGASCATICKKINAASCPAESDCMSSCQEQINATPIGCKPKLDAMTSCFAHTSFTCDADGEAQPNGCTKEIDAWATCLQENGATPGEEGGDDGTGDICAAGADDNTCDTCQKQKCCAELTACSDDADCNGLATCAAACADDTCVQTCLDTYPDGFAILDEAATCQTENCGTPCN